MASWSGITRTGLLVLAALFLLYHVNTVFYQLAYAIAVVSIGDVCETQGILQPGGREPERKVKAFIEEIPVCMPEKMYRG